MTLYLLPFGFSFLDFFEFLLSEEQIEMFFFFCYCFLVTVKKYQGNNRKVIGIFPIY